MPRFYNHKWNIVGEVCERCRLERRIKVRGDGFKNFQGVKYEYYVNGKWVEERPGCHDNKQFNQTYIRL